MDIFIPLGIIILLVFIQIKLFRDMCAEDEHLLDLCRRDVVSAAETMVDLETKYIYKMFEAGDVEGIAAEQWSRLHRRTHDEGSL